MDRRTTFLAPTGILLLAFLLAGCPSGSLLDLLTDREPPVPGGSGDLLISALSWDILRVSWDPAGDDKTAAEDLEYRVYYASNNTLGSFDEAEQYATPGSDWFTGDSAEFGGLSRDTGYWVNVFVRDRAGNIAAYQELEGATMAGPLVQVVLTGSAMGMTPFPANNTVIENLGLAQVDYGFLDSGDGPRTGTFEIQNIGDMDLTLTGGAPYPWMMGDSEFTVTQDIAESQAIIPKETAVVFEISAEYDGTHIFQDVAAEVSFNTNDPDNTTFKFEIVAYAAC